MKWEANIQDASGTLTVAGEQRNPQPIAFIMRFPARPSNGAATNFDPWRNGLCNRQEPDVDRTDASQLAPNDAWLGLRIVCATAVSAVKLAEARNLGHG